MRSGARLENSGSDRGHLQEAGHRRFSAVTENLRHNAASQQTYRQKNTPQAYATGVDCPLHRTTTRNVQAGYRLLSLEGLNNLASPPGSPGHSQTTIR